MLGRKIQMLIKVYNDGQLVHDGELQDFLNDNENDEWLTEEMEKLEEQQTVEFNAFSGHWLITKAGVM
jgi:ABC-type uncharacterized transport system ATPase subunit